MGFVDVDGVRMHYLQHGAGEDVVLLCGLGDDASAWDAQVGAFSEGYRVTVLDNRGVGRSSLPDGAFTVRDMAADTSGLMDSLGITNAHVAGFSMGGAIAQQLTLDRPDLVRSLVIVGSWCRSDRIFAETIRGAAWMAGVADDARPFLYAFNAWVYSPAFFADGRIDATVDAALTAPFPQETEAFQRTALAILEHDTRDRLHEIGVPTLVIVGTVDLLCPPRHSREIAERISGARLVEVPDQAHQRPARRERAHRAPHHHDRSVHVEDETHPRR
jgi:pimeloyl-ACP methyl ester carboxylesterase